MVPRTKNSRISIYPGFLQQRYEHKIHLCGITRVILFEISPELASSILRGKAVPFYVFLNVRISCLDLFQCRRFTPFYFMSFFVEERSVCKDISEIGSLGQSLANSFP